MQEDRFQKYKQLYRSFGGTFLPLPLVGLEKQNVPVTFSFDQKMDSLSTCKRSVLQLQFVSIHQITSIVLQPDML